MHEPPYTGDTINQRMPHAEIPGCALVQDLIPLYLDGEVTPESHVLMANHLQQCERCSGYLAGARSVRAQLLNEQQAVKAAASAGPTVAQLRQPVVDSIGVALWRLLMALTHLGGLALIFLGMTRPAPAALLLGPAACGIAITGLLVARSTQTGLWRLLMVLTGLLGLGLAVIGITMPYGDGPLAFVAGLGALIVAGWGWRLRTTLPPASPSASGAQTAGRARKAIWTVILGVLGVLVCLIVGMAGVALLADPGTGPRQVGGVVLTSSAIGLLLINRRLGWLGALAQPLATRRAIGGALLSGSLLLGALTMQNWINNLLPLLVIVGLVVGLGVFGLRLLRPDA